MRSIRYTSIFLITALISFSSYGCDTETGERQQRVFLSSGGQMISDWEATLGEIEKILLPNGLELGIQLNEPEPVIYHRQAVQGNYVSELVEINLYDLSSAEPELLSYTYGGTNSLQGFGPRGGANRVDEVGDSGILLTLLKPVCLQSSSLAATR